MKISRKKWHYRFVYGKHTSWRFDLKEPAKESFCSYWRKFILLMALMPFWTIFLLCAGAIAFYIYGSGFFFGYWPNFGKYRDEYNDELFHHQRKFDGRYHHRFAPYEIVLPLVAVAGIVYWAIESPLTLFFMAKWIGIGAAGLVSIAGIFFVLVRGWRSETFKFTRLWLSAQKIKACRIVEFVDEPKTSQA